jgi:hypothetical protein
MINLGVAAACDKSGNTTLLAKANIGIFNRKINKLVKRLGAAGVNIIAVHLDSSISSF